VVLLPNTLAHLNFEPVFFRNLSHFLLQVRFIITNSLLPPSSWGEALCQSVNKCDGGPKQLWNSAFECVFLQAHKQFGKSTIVGVMSEILLYRVWEGLHVGTVFGNLFGGSGALLKRWKSIWRICALFGAFPQKVVHLRVFWPVPALFGAPAYFLESPHDPKVPGGPFEGQAGYKGYQAYLLGFWKCFWRSWRIF